MTCEERRIKIFVAVDGKEFPTKQACQKYELDGNIKGARDKKIRELLAYLSSVKHGNSIWTIAGRKKRYDQRKADLLKAAKGKRRHLRKFAEDIERAARFFIDADCEYRQALVNYKNALVQLKTLEPRFCRSKKKTCGMSEI